MSDVLSPDLLKILQPLVEAISNYWSERHNRAAVKNASQLHFWREGMRAVLERIAGGDTTPETLAELQWRLAGTEDDVAAIRDKLIEMRDAIAGKPGGMRVAQLIDDILYGPVGKMVIRHQIDQILHDQTNAPAAARYTCNCIDAFNANIQRLHVLAFDR